MEKFMAQGGMRSFAEDVASKEVVTSLRLVHIDGYAVIQDEHSIINRSIHRF
jgi:hypothetical protein